MKTKAICSFFVLFAIAAVMVSSTPAAFADHAEVAITTGPVPLSAPGCGETDECYTPSTATVDVGGVVTMTNVDATGIHTFTSGTVDGFAASPDETFDSGILNLDQSFEWSPDTAGEYPYYCMLHVWMQGTIIVQEAEGAIDDEADAAAEAEAQAAAEAEAQAAAEAEAQAAADAAAEAEAQAAAEAEAQAAAEAEAQAAADAAAEEEVMISIEAEPAAAGETTDVTVTITNMDGSSTEHVNYDVTATQGSEVILDEKGVHDHDGVMTHTTMALPLDASSEMPVNVSVTFNGFGIDPPFTGPIGEGSTMQVVPEFGTIAMMVLAVAIISIVAITAKSRVVPRF